MEVSPVLIALVGGFALLLAGVVLLCLVRVVSAPREIVGDEPELLVLVVLGWILLIAGVGTAVLFVSFLFLGPAGLILGPVVALMAHFRHRRAQQYALLSALSVAAERLMPLAPVVDAFAEERWGLLERRSRRLAALLRAGMNLPDALYRAPGLVSRQAQATIRVGQESGSLAQALGDVVRSHEMHDTVWNQAMGRGIYLCGVILFACVLVIPFMMIKIIPEFAKIFEEFDAELPAMTEMVIAAARLFAHYWFLFAPVLLLLVVFGATLLFQYILGTRWNLPLLNRLTRRLDTAAVLESLALSAERNVGFAVAIDTLARWYPSGWVRFRLREVFHDLRAGADWSHSLAQRGLIRPVELAVFQAAGRAGNVAWALREMAESSRRRFTYRMYLLVQTLFPLAVLVLALLIGFYILACMLPLVSLIQNLT